LGCGTGSFTRRYFSNNDAEVYGIDISEKLIQLANQENTKINYLVGDVENLEFEDNYFDLVIFSGVLHHFQDINRCLTEAYRVLNADGCMLSYDPNINNPFMWLYRHPSSPFLSKIGKTDNEKLLSGNEVRQVMQAIGYKRIDTHCIGGVTFKTVMSDIGKAMLPFYNIFEQFFGKLRLARKYGSFLICYGEK
jgi:ubiquinone/menaquinone biosynthesis C-methylase UbiE